MNIGDRIKTMRIAKGINQKSLAASIGIKPPSLSDIENGVTKSVKADTILALSKALDCSADWLNTGRGSPSRPNHGKSIEEHELVSIFNVLNIANRSALLATARALMSSQEMPPSPVNPFPAKQ